MTRERRGIRHYHFASDLAVVRDVSLRHQEIAITDPRHSATARCPTMDRHELADLVPLANYCRSFFTRVFEVLRSEADRSERKDMSIVADGRVTVDDDMRVESYTIAEHDLVTDDRERSDVT